MTVREYTWCSVDTADINGLNHLQMTLTRAKLEQLTKDLAQHCVGPDEQALQDVGLTADQVDEVVLRMS